MDWKETIKTLVTEDSITCYWEKPEDAVRLESYTIFAECETKGEESGETRKTEIHSKVTHVFLEQLGSGCLYRVRIDRILNGRILDTVDFSVKTTPRRERIDITASPYFAVGDGKKLNTEAIQRAINDCGCDQCVYIPAGVFLTGALRLHDNMELYIEKDAVLQGTDNPEDYLPRIWSRFEGTEMECYSSVLNIGMLDHNDSYNCENIVIRGGGTIASGGRVLAENIINSEKERLREKIAALGDEIRQYENENTIPGRVRPRLINISNARNIRLSGLTLKNGAAWNVHMVYSDEIVTDHCTFHSLNIWNGDGWDPDSSTNCTLFASVFYTGDDSVAIKSGKNPEGNQINRPCEHIRIFDVCCACGLGIAVGSEMSGGVSNVKIWDCDMKNTRYGLEIKGTKKRGGYVKNIIVRDSEISRILFHSVGYNDDGTGAENPPVFRDCIFENLTITGKCLNETKEKLVSCTAIELCGFEEEGYQIDNVKFKNIKLMDGENDGTSIRVKYCKNLSFINMETDR